VEQIEGLPAQHTARIAALRRVHLHRAKRFFGVIGADGLFMNLGLVVVAFLLQTDSTVSRGQQDWPSMQCSQAR